VLLTVMLPYLRGPEGTGAAFAAHAGRRELLLATLTLLAVAVALFRVEGVVLVGILALAGAGFGLWIRRRLGGVTGDVLGAAAELLELLTLLLLLILLKG
jgi:adenosylcobinamide-GDP ribazoletransferase